MKTTVQQLIDLNLIAINGGTDDEPVYVWNSTNSIITFSVDGTTHIVDTIECSEDNMIAIMVAVNGAYADMAEGYKFYDLNNHMSLKDLADRSHMYDNDHKMKVLADTSFYCQNSDGEENETMRVQGFDPDELMLYATGEESGEEYSIGFDDIDLRKDLFYTIEKLDPSKY